VENETIRISNMIMIGATGQNSGKTTFAAEIIRRWRKEFPIIALKITSVNQQHAHCVRGGAGCGACSSLCDSFELSEETDPASGKDTSLLLAAGAHRVYWMKCMKEHLGDGIRHFLLQIPEDALILCESNSLRKIALPGLFVMLQNARNAAVKPSAEEVIDKADLVVVNDFGEGIRTYVSQISIACGASGIEIHLTQE
jgi:hypothetical protein